mgnify:CR=1 FL=1
MTLEHHRLCTVLFHCSCSNEVCRVLVNRGSVYSVIMDENHFFFRDVLGTFDPTFIGYVYWGSVNLKLGGLNREDILKYCTLAKPYFNWLTYTPLNTEIVDLIKAPSNNHYTALNGTHTSIEYFYYLLHHNLMDNIHQNSIQCNHSKLAISNL